MISGAMKTALPSTGRVLPDGRGRFRFVGPDERVKRATDLMVHVAGKGPRRVYTRGDGVYFILEKKRRKEVDLEEVLRWARR